MAIEPRNKQRKRNKANRKLVQVSFHYFSLTLFTAFYVEEFKENLPDISVADLLDMLCLQRPTKSRNILFDRKPKKTPSTKIQSDKKNESTKSVTWMNSPVA
jgi:hypothetical protein